MNKQGGEAGYRGVMGGIFGAQEPKIKQLQRGRAAGSCITSRFVKEKGNSDSVQQYD